MLLIPQPRQLLLDLLFQPRRFLEQLVQIVGKTLHLCGELLRRQIDILDLHLEILPGAQAVILGGDLVVADHHREILHRLLGVEGGDDAVFLGRRTAGFSGSCRP